MVRGLQKKKKVLIQVQPSCLHLCSVRCYREDYIRLGVSEKATKEEIKAAYFEKAKQLHPDANSSSENEVQNQTEFFELNEAYKRLMYESKYGTDSFDEMDPRNDPRSREYWEIRTRRRSPEEIKFEELMANKARDKERKIIRRGMIALIIGVFFGTIFPALFIGGNDYDNGFDHGCQCERCLIKKLRDNPTMNHLKKSSKTSLVSSHD